MSYRTDGPERAAEAVKADRHVQLCVTVLVWSKTDPGKALAVSRKDDRSKFSMPGGKVDPVDFVYEEQCRHGRRPDDLYVKADADEYPWLERVSRAAAVREVFEETGLVVRPQGLERLFGTGVYRDGLANRRFATAYLALDWSGDLVAEEPCIVKWTSPAELEVGPFGDVYERVFDQLGVRLGRLRGV